MSGSGCSAQVLAAVAKWRLLESSEGENTESGHVIPAVREWVVASVPKDPAEARTSMHAVVRLALWTKARLGVADAATVFASPTVDAWLLSAEHPYAQNTLRTIRSLVRKVGRAVLSSPTPATALPVQWFSSPYSADEERWFREGALLEGYRNPSTRMWAVAGPLGGGLNGPEAAAAAAGDICEHGDGRLTVTVRGRNARTVPIRRAYTELARAALAAADGNQLVTSARTNNAYFAARRVGRGLSFARARTTWLLAHVEAGTHPVALRLIAGPVSERTIRLLSEIVVSTMTNDEAVRLGMKP